MTDIIVGLVKHEHTTTEYKPSGASPGNSQPHRKLRVMSGMAIGIWLGLLLQERYPLIQDRFASYIGLLTSIIESAIDFF